MASPFRVNIYVCVSRGESTYEFISGSREEVSIAEVETAPGGRRDLTGHTVARIEVVDFDFRVFQTREDAMQWLEVQT